MLKAAARLPLKRQGPRALAVLAFLYFLSAFIQSGYVTPTQIIGGVLWLLLCYMLSQRLGIVTVLALSFAISVLWGIVLESVPTHDSFNFNKSAYLLSSGDFSQPFFSKSAPTVAYYAVFHWLLGSEHVTGYIASAAAWTGGAAFVYRTILHCIDDQRMARFISFGLALCPAFVIFSTTPSSEPVYFLLSAICAWLISRHLIRRGPFPYLYVALGLVTGALFLTRTNGILALLICLLVIGVGREAFLPKCDRASGASDERRFRRRLALCMVVVASFMSIWFAHGYLAWVSGQGFQATSSPYGPVNLLFGTSIHANGRYNIPDLELAGYRGANKLPLAQANEKARKIAVERIVGNPVDFVRFALTDKVSQLWDKDYFFFNEAAGIRNRNVELDQWVQYRVLAGRDSVYRVTFLLFLVFLVREIWRPSRLLSLGVIPFLYSLPHVLVEVAARYHLTMLPFIIVGSMLIANDLWSRRSEWLAVVRRQRLTWLDNRAA